MINFDDISPDEIIAKGQYSIVRAAHEDALKRLRLLLEELSRFGPALLKEVQPDDYDRPVAPETFANVHGLIVRIASSTFEVEDLRIQRAELKAKAWPKGNHGT